MIKLIFKSSIHIFTDGESSMIDYIKRLCFIDEKYNKNVFTTHYFLHREALVTKTIGPH